MMDIGGEAYISPTARMDKVTSATVVQIVTIF